MDVAEHIIRFTEKTVEAVKFDILGKRVDDSVDIFLNALRYLAFQLLLGPPTNTNMSQSDFQSSQDQEPGETSGGVHEAVPSLLSRIMHVALGLAHHIRENPVLRAEVIQILRHFEAVITPSEPSDAPSTPAGATKASERSEGVTDQVPVPVPTQEPERVPIPEALPVAVDAATLRDLQTGLAAVNAFAERETMPAARRTTIRLDRPLMLGESGGVSLGG